MDLMVQAHKDFKSAADPESVKTHYADVLAKFTANVDRVSFTHTVRSGRHQPADQGCLLAASDGISKRSTTAKGGTTKAMSRPEGTRIHHCG